MTTFYPDKFKKKVLPKSFFSRGILNKTNFNLKSKAMQALILANSDLDRKEIQKTVVGVAAVYEKKVDELRSDGLPKAKAVHIAKEKESLLKQRLENLVVFSEVTRLKKKNKGKYYKWLPSGADEPSPQHQLLYGKTFLVGEGDEDGNMPGERYGCQCGMEILDSKETS